MGRPPKVGGIRTTRVGENLEPEAPVIPDIKTGIYQFRSRNAAFRLSLRRRRIERDADGNTMEVAPRTKDQELDLPLDMVKFEDNYFETPSEELANLIKEKAMKMGTWGVGLEVWSVTEERQTIDAALERELRERIAARPDIAKRVLTPSDAEDFALPAPPV